MHTPQWAGQFQAHCTSSTNALICFVPAACPTHPPWPHWRSRTKWHGDSPLPRTTAAEDLSQPLRVSAWQAQSRLHATAASKMLPLTWRMLAEGLSRLGVGVKPGRKGQGLVEAGGGGAANASHRQAHHRLVQ